MEIKLCQNLSENNIINKSIVEVDTATASIKGAISVEAPVLILAYDASLQDINYLKIPEFSRNYYITDMINLTGGRYEIRAKTDVLESFKDDILQLSVVTDKRQGSNGINMYLDDGSFITENREFNRVINFPAGFNDDGEYILITAGGGGGII